MLQDNINFLTANNSEKEQKIAIAISGGADSTALLFIVKELMQTKQIIGLTVDHGLRSESEKEAQLVQRLCQNLGIEHHILRWIPSKKQTQETAREARYKLLTQFCKEHRISKLFVAHHQEDLLETFIMRIWQKSKILGLASISAYTQKNGIAIIRPLLNIERSELISYLRQKNISHIEDPSNHNQKYLRTKARNLILTEHEKSIFLKFINLVGRLRSHFEEFVLKKIQELSSWETPYTLRVKSSFFMSNSIVLTIFIEKLARIMGYSNFFKSNTTNSIIQNLSQKSPTTGYLLYWSENKGFIYISQEKKISPPPLHIHHPGIYHFDIYTLELKALRKSPEPFILKFTTIQDCIHIKKTQRINFLFSKTRAPLPSFLFEDLIVFLDEIEYDLKTMEEKGWNIKILSTDIQPIAFAPFSVLPDSGVSREQR